MPRGRPKGSKNKIQETQQDAAPSPGLQYVVSMKLNGTVHERKANIMKDALDMFDWNFYKKTLSRLVVFPTVLTVNYENNKTEIQLSPYQLRRFFYSPIYRRITEKHINKLWRQQ